MGVDKDLFSCSNCGVVFTEQGYNHIGYVDMMDMYFIKEGACPACGQSNAEVRKVDV